MFSVCGILPLIFITIVNAKESRYDVELEKYNTMAEKLKIEIEGLHDQYRGLLSQYNVTTYEKVPDVLNKSKSLVETLTNNRNDYIANTKERFKKMLDNADETVIEPYAGKHIGKAYPMYIGYLLKRMDQMEKKFSTLSNGYNSSYASTSIGVNKKMKEYENIIAPVQNKVTEILKGSMSEENRQLKEKTIEILQENMFKITRQAQMDAFHEDEKQRSDGNSGIKQVRVGRIGSKNYHSNTHTGNSFSAIHDHSNNIRTVGMGEFIGVLNGVEFRTRHNDYRLKKPTDDTKYHATKDVEFPSIPPSVTRQSSIEGQAAEMREYFKAFHMQDPSHRDYRPYFKPLLVYLEGAWTSSKSGSIDEPFESDRHHIDAKSWLDLQEKVRFTSYAGSKSLLENLAHLPTKIIRFTEDRQPVLAQWNYRILCHPIDTDSANLELKDFQLVVDQTVLRRNRMDEEKYKNSRAAKFDIEGINVNGEREDNRMLYTLLDKIMEQIPGKDNYGADIQVEDNLYYPNSTRKINAAYYHRAFERRHESQIYPGQVGFSDRFWVAYNTQDKVAAVSYRNKETNELISRRVSYAVPVEIIWLTPLHSWNPYNVQRFGTKEMTGDGSKSNPYIGYADNKYFLTPHLFYSGEEEDRDPADTVKAGAMLVKTPSGTKALRSSGTRIFFPKIDGIDGKIRQRYPIMPVFGEGSAVWKKLNAIEDALKDIKNPDDQLMYFQMGMSHASITPHRHNVAISAKNYEKLMQGEIQELKISSDEAISHIHDITISVKDGQLYVKECAGTIPDPVGHPNQLCRDFHEDTMTLLL